MSEAGYETEVKFYVRRLSQIPRLIQELGGYIVSPRTFELNYRLDTRDGTLRREGRALRLRRDRETRLTYKGPSEFLEGARHRQETEVTVGDLDGARQLLSSLGYVVTFVYEKYRTTYSLGPVQIMLDELPYGDFVEIEGPIEALPSCALQLRLTWASAVPQSYHGLFEHLLSTLTPEVRELTFADFSGISVGPDQLGVQAADS